MTLKIIFLLLTCSIIFSDSRKILTQSLENERSSEKALPTIELIPKTVLDLVDVLRSFSFFQIVRLARFVINGDLSPKILIATAVMKSLTAQELQIIQDRVNINQLSKKTLKNLNYLIFLNDDEKQKILEIKSKNYLSFFDLSRNKVSRYDHYSYQKDNSFIRLVDLFHQLDSNKLERIIILQDMEILPVNILEHISVIKSIDPNQLYKIINKNIPASELLETTLSQLKNLDLDQVDLILKVANLNSKQMIFLYSLALFYLIPPEQFNIIVHQFNLKDNIRNIIDLMIEFKLLPNEVIKNIKLFSEAGMISTIILNAFDFLEKISLIEINHLVYDLGLGIHMSKYLSPFLSSKIQNTVNMLRKFDSKKLLKLSLHAKNGLISDYLVTAASISSSLSPDQMEKIIRQKNLNQLPKYVLEMLEYFRKLPEIEYKLISSLVHENINNFLNPNQTISKTWSQNKEYLSKINGCFESKTVTIITTKIFTPVDELGKCATDL